MGSHLSRLEDLDGLDIRFLAPAAGTAFGQRTASRPFGAAVGRDGLGPDPARRVRGEVDHDAVRVDAARAAALVHLARGIGGFELDAHHYSDHQVQNSAILTLSSSLASASIAAFLFARGALSSTISSISSMSFTAGKLLRLLVTLPPVRD